jgi:HTH-type transcriptional regulator / antitoxin HipB
MELLFDAAFPIGNILMITTEQLGGWIRDRRKELGVTQKDLAMTSGTGLRFIIDLEKGKPTCQIGKAFKVLEAMGGEIRIETRGREGEQ